jgi:hypothetical protein
MRDIIEKEMPELRTLTDVSRWLSIHGIWFCRGVTVVVRYLVASNDDRFIAHGERFVATVWANPEVLVRNNAIVLPTPSKD